MQYLSIKYKLKILETSTLFVSLSYGKLNQLGIIKNSRRYSWKNLKTKLLQSTFIADKQKIKRCFVAFKVLLFLLYAELTLILIQLNLSAEM